MSGVHHIELRRAQWMNALDGGIFEVITSKDTGLYDPALETTDYLVEGIVGTV